MEKVSLETLYPAMLVNLIPESANDENLQIVSPFTRYTISCCQHHAESCSSCTAARRASKHCMLNGLSVDTVRLRFVNTTSWLLYNFKINCSELINTIHSCLLYACLMCDNTSKECPRKRIKLAEDQKSLGENLPANEVANLCYQTYLQLGKSGKPTDTKAEHTVLACIVESEKRVVALATGTKCFPQNVANRHEEIVDCHAEPLLKRAFKSYLIELIDDWLVRGKAIDQFYDQVLKPRRYCLFVSQTPCGCVSRWKGDALHSTEPREPDLKSYKVMGINRKPGRGDLCPKAGCIHKVAKWNVFGLQGRSLLPLIGKAITLQKIVVGNCEQNAGEFQYEEMIARLTVDQEELKVIRNQLQSPHIFNFTSPSHTLIEFASKFRYEDFVRDSDGVNKRPTGSSISAWLKESGNAKGTRPSLQFEVIASGRKLGVGRSKRRKELTIDTRPSDTAGDVIGASTESTEANRSATKMKATSASKHRPADLAVSDSGLNQRVGQLVDRLHRRCAKADTNAEDNDSREKEKKSAKLDDKSWSNTNQIVDIYAHNWQLIRRSISIFKGWPSIPTE